MYEFIYRGYTILHNSLGDSDIYFIVQGNNLTGGTRQLIDLIKKIDEQWEQVA